MRALHFGSRLGKRLNSFDQAFKGRTRIVFGCALAVVLAPALVQFDGKCVAQGHPEGAIRLERNAGLQHAVVGSGGNTLAHVGMQLDGGLSASPQVVLRSFQRPDFRVAAPFPSTNKESAGGPDKGTRHRAGDNVEDEWWHVSLLSFGVGYLVAWFIAMIFAPLRGLRQRSAAKEAA